MKRCTLILTDSGGIQEGSARPGRARARHAPQTTERPEGVRRRRRETGRHRGGLPSSPSVRQVAHRSSAAHAAMARGANPYGDGKAAQRIVDAILHAPSR